MSKLTYEEASAAMQAGVSLKMQLAPTETNPKHLRVGVNSAMVEHGALAGLLIAKGLITRDEFLVALEEGMRAEVALYERELTAIVGRKVTLGYDPGSQRGFAHIEGEGRRS